MTKIKVVTCIIILSVLSPLTALALEMPTTVSQIADMEGLTAKSYIVVDKASGQVLVAKEPNLSRVPASLTKLVTVLVFFDSKPNLKKTIAITQDDQAKGGCRVGGACLATKPGIKYTLNNLLYASLMSSANNATHALARSTGLSEEQFVAKMNEKAKSLGAEHTVFYETTGMDPRNSTTALDYAKIAAAAFDNPLIHKIDTTKTYSFTAYNSRKYRHNLKNTNKLLGDAELTVIGGKTGYLEESSYNFVTEVKDRSGNNLVVALFGSQNSSSQFSETKKLTQLAGLAKFFYVSQAMVFGTSTAASYN